MVVGRILVTLRLIQETVDKLISDVKQDWSFIFLVYLLKVIFKNSFFTGCVPNNGCFTFNTGNS